MFPTVLSANTPASGAYQISNSVRFRSPASAYFSRTPSVAGNRTTWTWSGWVKRGALGASQVLFDCEGGFTDTTFGEFGFNGSDAFEFIAYNLSWRVTSQVFRDPSAWYHLVVAFDTTQATAANRVKIYVNGYQITAFSTSNDPAQNTSYAINQAAVHNIAKVYGGRGYFDGYLADINFIDGQALTPSSFGQINPTTGVWQPIKYAGTYGTNGFHLAFNNGTSTTTLGNDSSGNGNNWTPNNISLTAGSTYDWMLDSPTNYDNGGNGVGNYCVMSPLGNGSSSAVSSQLSYANLRYSGSSAGGSTGSMAIPPGTYYFETTIQSIFGLAVGLGSNSRNLQADFGTTLGGYWGWYINPTITKFTDSTATTWSGNTVSVGTVVNLAVDATNQSSVKLWLGKANVWYDSSGGTTGNPTTGSNPTITITSGVSLYPIVGFYAGGASTVDINFGQRPFAYTPPSGYKTLCTQNLPTPTIQNGAAHMAATLYTGTGASQSITNTVNGTSLTPDLTWIKSRSAATDHKLTDIVRGVTKGLISDSTAAETTDTNGLTAFNSNGFTIGSDAVYNNNAATYIAWQWKAGGTAVTNTAGSITSQVSANTTAGFSVVTYTCQSSGSGTIGHGLGVAPSMIISKGRGTVTSWGTYHVSNGWNGYLVLNGTNSFITDPNGMNNTAPTSSVWTQGTTYAGIGTMVAYCFAAIAGYSAFGSYTGNGSTDGVFVWCGFRPRYVLIKRTDSAVGWMLFDTSRSTYNVAMAQLNPDTSAAEDSSYQWIDILSNGFKLRNGSYLAVNASGGSYIYACFAENPFQNSLAR